MLLYLYKLFDRRSVYRKVIVVGFAVCFSAALAFGILSVRQVFGTHALLSGLFEGFLTKRRCQRRFGKTGILALTVSISEADSR